MGAGAMDYKQLSQKIELKTGGVSAEIHVLTIDPRIGGDHLCSEYAHLVTKLFVLVKHSAKYFRKWNRKHFEFYVRDSVQNLWIDHCFAIAEIRGVDWLVWKNLHFGLQTFALLRMFKCCRRAKCAWIQMEGSRKSYVWVRSPGQWTALFCWLSASFEYGHNKS